MFMRFVINREQFVKALLSVSKAVPQKVELPILANIKLELNEKGLEVTGSDNNMVIRTTVPYRVNEQDVIRNYKYGAVLVNSKIILEVIRKMEGEEVSIELIDGTVLRVDDGRSNFKLNSISADEYIEIDLSPIGSVFSVHANELLALVEQTFFAASTKETRPVLSAINLECADHILTATATDTARLARKRIEIENDVRFNVNIHAKKLYDIVRSFEGADIVDVSISDKKAQFAFANTIISTRLTNGEYPNTKNIVPKVFNYYLQVNSKEFISAMERVSILSADRDGVIKLIMSDDGVEMISRSALVGSANEKITMYNFDGDRFEISFRASFVADAIKAIRSEDVTICFIGEMKPFVVRNNNDTSIDMLVTPLRA